LDVANANSIYSSLDRGAVSRPSREALQVGRDLPRLQQYRNLHRNRRNVSITGET
jgi:hypothetical protein